MEGQIQKILVYIGGISLITFAIGSYIINSFLSSFQITDYDLLQPHAVIVGLTCLIFIAIHIFIVLMFLDLNTFRETPIKKLFFITVAKFFFAVNTLFLFMGGVKYMFDSFYQLQIWKWKFDLGKHSLWFGFMFCSLLVLLYPEFKKDPKGLFTRIFKGIIYFGLGCNVISLLIYFNVPLYQDIFYFELSFFGLFLFLSLLIVDSKRDTKFKGGWFSNEPIGEKLQFIPLAMSILAFAGTFFSITNKYILDIYPHINESFGGGKLENITFVCKSDTITGEKVYETKDYVFLHNKDSTITKVEWSNIDKIITYMKKSKKKQLVKK